MNKKRRFSPAMAILLAVIVAIPALMFVIHQSSGTLYQDDLRRSRTLGYAVDYAVFTARRPPPSGRVEHARIPCRNLLKGDYSGLDRLAYGECGLGRIVSISRYDFFWWLGGHKVALQFPVDAYRMDWVRERVDAALADPCQYSPARLGRDDIYPQLADWDTLGCGAGDRYEVLLLLTENNGLVAERKRFNQ
jgi:hypothetical protein